VILTLVALKSVLTPGAYLSAAEYRLTRRFIKARSARTFAVELKQQRAQTLAAFATSILAQPHGRPDAQEAAEPPLRQIIDVLQQVMCAHDAEKLAISVLEIHEGGYREGRPSD
jgi:hypothetical protein